MVWFQDSISEHLHHHTFSNMLANKIFETHSARTLSCSNLGVGIWSAVRLTFPTFQLSSPSFSTRLWMWHGLTHPSITSNRQCVCPHLINATNVHLLCFTHGNEHMGTHDAIHNTFVAITWNVDFHVGQEQLHMFPSTTFHSSHRWIEIVFTKDGIHIQIDVVIIDPKWADLLCWSCGTQKFVTFKVVQTKKKELLQLTPHWSFFPFNNWNLWMFR